MVRAIPHSSGRKPTGNMTDGKATVLEEEMWASGALTWVKAITGFAPDDVEGICLERCMEWKVSLHYCVLSSYTCFVSLVV